MTRIANNSVLFQLGTLMNLPAGGKLTDIRPLSQGALAQVHDTYALTEQRDVGGGASNVPNAADGRTSITKRQPNTATSSQSGGAAISGEHIRELLLEGRIDPLVALGESAVVPKNHARPGRTSRTTTICGAGVPRLFWEACKSRNNKPLWPILIPGIATLIAAAALLPASALPITLSIGMGVILGVIGGGGNDEAEADVNQLNEADILDISLEIHQATDPEERSQGLQLLRRMVDEHQDSITRRLALETLVARCLELGSMGKLLELALKCVDLALDSPSLETAEFATKALAYCIVAVEQPVVATEFLSHLEIIGIRSKGTEREELVYRALDHIQDQLAPSDDVRASWALMIKMSVQNALVIKDTKDVATCLELALGSDDTQAAIAHRAFLSWGFRHQDPNVVAASVNAIGHLVDNAPHRITSETVTALYHVGRVHILHSPIAKAVARVLRRIAEIIPSEITSEMVEILLKLGLQNKDPEVIAAAAEALGIVVVNAEASIAGEATQAIHIGAQSADPTIAREFDRVRQQVGLQVPDRVGDPTMTDIPLQEEVPPPKDPTAESPAKPTKTIMRFPEKEKPD